GEFHHFQDSNDRLALESELYDLVDRKVLLDESLEDRIEHLVWRQRVRVLLIRPQLGGRRARQHTLGDRRRDGVPVTRELKHQRLVAVLERGETAGHVAV